MNNVNLLGHLWNEPELRYTKDGGTAICRFGLAVSRGLSKSKEEEAKAQGKPTADFINIISFGKTAELVSNYLSKGRQVALQGRIQTSSYEGQDGKRIYRTDVVADKVEFIGENNKNNNTQFSTKDNGENYGFGNDAYPLNDDDIPF